MQLDRQFGCRWLFQHFAPRKGSWIYQPIWSFRPMWSPIRLSNTAYPLFPAQPVSTYPIFMTFLILPLLAALPKLP